MITFSVLTQEVLNDLPPEELPSNDTVQPEAQAALGDDKLLDRLVELWKSHHQRDLEVRHETGKLLNKQFGSPNERKKRGEEVLKQACERLKTTKSELSRMRRFAFHFDSISDLMGQHPEVDNWSKVKELLPKLKPATEQGATPQSKPAKKKAASAKGASRKPVKAVGDSLSDLLPKLRRLREPTDAEKKSIREKLQKFADTVPSCLGVRVSIEEVANGDSTAA